MKADILKEFIRKVWDEGNDEAASEYVASSYTIHHDPGDPWEGMTLDLEGFKERVRKSRQPVPDQRFTLQEIFENKNSVAITWLWQGTHLGDIAGFPGTVRIPTQSGHRI